MLLRFEPDKAASTVPVECMKMPRGVIGEQRAPGQHVMSDGSGQRFQQRRRLADPAGERRAVEIYAFAGEDAGLAVERQVIAILRVQRMRQKTGAGPAALDRPHRQRRLVELLASAAGQTRTHDALHHKAAGNVLQLLGDILAHPLQMASAGGAALVRRENRLLVRVLTIIDGAFVTFFGGIRL